MLPTVNRSAVIVRPKQPFLDWLHGVDPTSRNLSLEDLGGPTIYLLPECEDDQIMMAHLRKYCDTIFEEQLEGWWRDRTAWPAKRGFKMFCIWFDFQTQMLLLDVCEKPLRRD